MGPPVHANEAQRLAALKSCRILDTPPEPAFDGIALVASQLCNTPIALVTLVDESRQWFKARVGVSVRETPREVSFCAHAIQSNEPLVIDDARQDPRFADNPLVTEDPHFRFYAGLPLVLDDGSTVGTLCVIDHVPRRLTPAQLSALSVLARQVSTELSLRRKLASTAPPSRQQGTSGLALADSPTLDQKTMRQLGSSVMDLKLPVPVGTLVEQRYRMERVIGHGGMGVVARAVDTKSGAPVALKFMLAHALTRHDAVDRFVREAQVLLTINHPHVARVFDVGNLPSGEPYMVMEFLEGHDLKARLEREGPLAIDDAIRLAIELCEALACAHDHGILHRDLKPANLFVTRGPKAPGVLKVLDFGISKLVGIEGPVAPLTSDATVVGSPHYMSPEQMASPARIDARSDLWSVGVVLFELLTGSSPFEGQSLAEVCAQVLTAEPPPVHARRREVPEALSAIIARCLRKAPDERYHTAVELAEALRAIAR